MSNAVSRLANDSDTISVELSGVTTMPLGNSRSPATSWTDRSGRIRAITPAPGSAPAMKSKPMLLT
jgi:hypothetical protein